MSKRASIRLAAVFVDETGKISRLFFGHHQHHRQRKRPCGSETAKNGRNPTPTRHNPVMPKVIIFSKFILLIGLMSGFLRVSGRSKVCSREKPAARSNTATVRGQDLSGERRAVCVETPGLFSHRRVLRGEVTRRCYFGPGRCGPFLFSALIPRPLKNPGTDSVYDPYRLEPGRTCRSGPPLSLPFRSPP